MPSKETDPSGPLEHHLLRAFPQYFRAELAQFLLAFDDRQKMIARELPHLACEAARAVREDDLGLAIAAGIEQDVADRRMARVILEADRDAVVLELELAERHPAALATPAHVDQLLPVRQQLQKRGHGLRRIRMRCSDKRVAAGGQFESGHGGSSGG